MARIITFGELMLRLQPYNYCMSGIPSRPYCKGRNYDPNRYNSN